MAKVIPIIKNNRKFFKRHESEIPCLFFMKFNNRASAGECCSKLQKEDEKLQIISAICREAYDKITSSTERKEVFQWQ